jgi:hypothetical protein
VSDLYEGGLGSAVLSPPRFLQLCTGAANSAMRAEAIRDKDKPTGITNARMPFSMGEFQRLSLDEVASGCLRTA